MREVFLLLGSNRGDRRKLLHQALGLITHKAGPILQSSSIFETEPWGFTDPIPFLNQAIEIETILPPEKLLETILDIESTLGRTRPGYGCHCPNLHTPGNPLVPKAENEITAYSGRTIDIDILFYGQKMIFTTTLMVPHPRLHERRFALEPLSEIAPGFKHPVLGKTVGELLKEIRNNK